MSGGGQTDKCRNKYLFVIRRGFGEIWSKKVKKCG
jgi:hypothetical protein